MLLSLNTISEQQANPNQNMEATITHFIYYAATNLIAIVQYKGSDTVLHIDSGASYLFELWICSRTGGQYYIRYLSANPTKSPNLPPPANGPIHKRCIIRRHIVASDVKVKCREIFHNGKTYVPLRININELSLPQLTTPIKTDNPF